MSSTIAVKYVLGRAFTFSNASRPFSAVSTISKCGDSPASNEVSKNKLSFAKRHRVYPTSSLLF